MRYELVSVTTSHDDAARWIRLSGRPLSARETVELVAAAEEASADRQLRAVVLTSAGVDFCPGAAPDLDPVSVGADPAAVLATVRVPIVAALRGRAHGVGVELALTADIVVATPGTVLSFDAGCLPCWGGTQRLPRAVGRGRATAMLLLGEALDADAAMAAGLVWQIAPGPEPDPDGAASSIVEQLVGLGPLALAYAKEAVHRGSELPMRDGLRLEGDLNALLATSADRAEGLAAFFAKRPADFAGR